MAGWKHCGESFSVIDKYKPFVNASTQIQVRGKNNAEQEIHFDKTPERKTTSISKKNNGPSGEQILQAAVWKQQEFLSEFHQTPDITSPKSEDIEWASSSESDSSPHPSPERHKKRRHVSPQQHGTASPPPKRVSYESTRGEVEKQDHVGDSGGENCINAGGGHVTSSDAGNISSPRKHEQSVSVLHEHSSSPTFPHSLSLSQQPKARKNLDNCWTSSIELKSNKTSHCLSQWGRTREGNLSSKTSLKKTETCHKWKPRFTKGFDCHSSQDSCGQILDVDSDSDTDSRGGHTGVLSLNNNKECLSPPSTPPRPLKSSVSPSQEAGVVSDVPSPVEVKQHGVDKALTSPSSELRSSQVSIDSEASSSISSQPDKITASDWVSALHKHNTPVKSRDPQHDQCHDSAKKKRKYARGSLASQLLRLQTREKSSTRFWYHSLRAETQTEKCGKSITVRLLSLHRHCAVYVSHMTVIEGAGQHRRHRALFLKDTVDKLFLRPGMTVKIFPPWQQLEESSGVCTLLCTHCVQVIAGGEQPGSTTDIARQAEWVTGHADWSCPCRQDVHLPASACPAAVCPVVPHSLHSQQGMFQGQHQPPVTAMLHSVPASVDITAGPTLATAGRSLLDSMEDIRAGVTHLSPFTASVLRVFRYRETETWRIRSELLLEDVSGTLGLVTLSDTAAVTPADILRLTGRTCLCRGLSVLSRTNRDREPALFSVLERVWSQRPAQPTSQDSDSGQSQHHKPHPRVPNYAYVMQAAGNVQSTFSEDESRANGQISAVDVVDLTQALRCVSNTRVSFVAKGLFPARIQQRNGPVHVYMYDCTQDANGYTRVCSLSISSECVLDNTDSQDSHLYLCQDVIYENGELQCDRYSQVVSWSSWSLWSQQRVKGLVVDRVSSCQLHVPAVSAMARPGSVVSVEGTICDIDESSACTWEECDVCGSEHLASSEELGQTYCTGCNRRVDVPVTRMKMEVGIHCANLSPALVVKVDLCQSTIQALLPDIPADQGYEIEQVLGKLISCPACVVDSIDHTDHSDPPTLQRSTVRLTQLIQPAGHQQDTHSQSS